MAAVTEPLLRWSEQDALHLHERIVLILVTIYFVLNRAIPDSYVAPFGVSIRAHEIALSLLILGWMVWASQSRRPFPSGALGLSGVALLAVLATAPFWAAVTMNVYENNGAERGLFRLLTFAVLFIAIYQLAVRRRSAKYILKLVLVTGTIQALLGVWEGLTRAPLPIFGALAQGMGLILDPRGIRDTSDLFFRESGDVRAATSSPHPIVFSAVVVLSIMVLIGWLMYAKDRKQRRWAIIGLALNLAALPVSNSRTGFVMLAAILPVLIVLNARRLPQMVPLGMLLAVFLAIAIVLFPGSFRLVLNSFTNASDDPNTQIRVERLALVPHLMEERPIIGAGYLTFDPSIQIFDNAYNLALIELGLLGTAVLITFFLVAINRCRRGAHIADHEDAIYPISGLIAGLALLVGGVTFDAWTFDQFLPTCLVFMALGCGRTHAVLRERQLAGRSAA
jgi:hypothetical protein